MTAFAAALMLVAMASQASDQLYRDGVAARLAGDNAQAEALLTRLVAAEPANADAALQLGLVHLALGRLDEAEAAFRRTLALAPNYDDARIGLARVAQRRGDSAQALATLAPVAPDNSEAQLLRTQLTTQGRVDGTKRWQVDIDGSYNRLRRQPDWTDGALRLRYQATPATGYSAAIEPSRRFGLSDVYGEIRADRRFSSAASGYALLGGTPGADFRPEWQLGLGGAVRVAPGPNPTVLTFDARQAAYRSGDIQTFNPGVDQYFARGRGWLSARWINVFDEDGDHQSGWLLRGDAMALPRLRLFAGAADAPDTSEGVVTRIFSLFGGLSYEVSDAMTLRASINHDDSDTGTDRIGFGLGAGWKM